MPRVESDFCTAILGVENSECIENERRTRQSAPIVAKNVKFHSNLTEAGLFIVENATQREDHHEDTKIVQTNKLEEFLFLQFFNPKFLFSNIILLKLAE